MWRLFCTKRTAILALIVGLSGHALAGQRATLDAWPPELRRPLAELIERHRDAEPRAYVVFDADNTLWQHDVEYSLMAFLEAEGRIRLKDLLGDRPLIPAIEGESVTSYHRRLCARGKPICTLWLAQVFSGLSLAEARAAIGRMMAAGEPIQTFVLKGGEREPVTIHPPRFYPAQVQLVAALRAAGIEVFVVSASLEELVRVLVADPAHGLGLPPENVIGVNLLLRAPDGRLFAGAFERDAGRRGRKWFFSPERLQARLTATLISPGTWFIGKQAAIQRYIDPVARPILVAGDATTDEHMLLYADAARGGLRLFVRRKEDYWRRIQAAAEARARPTRFGPGDPSATRGWLTVTPSELMGGAKR